MNKQLCEMTLTDLWELFPIILTEHDPRWNGWYSTEAARLAEALPLDGVRMSHIGSTAIPGIWAKPIVDILLEIPESASMEQIKSDLTGLGYTCMSEGLRRKSFNKGYTAEGFAEKVFHLHLRFRGDNDELYFRDYMKENPAIAKEYVALKLSLWKKFEHDRDAYTDAKTSFIQSHTAAAKKIYGARYS